MEHRSVFEQIAEVYFCKKKIFAFLDSHYHSTQPDIFFEKLCSQKISEFGS
jgi:hypothetical protein